MNSDGKRTGWWQRLSGALQTLATPRNTVLITAAFLIFCALTLPALNTEMMAVSDGLGTPDRRLFYDREQLFALAEVFGAEGRRAYIASRLRIDVALPIGYMLVLSSWMGCLRGRVTRPGQWLNLLPVAAMTADLVEGLAVSMVMAAYPVRDGLWSMAAMVATPMKWGFVLLSLGAVVLLAWRRFGRRADASVEPG